MDARLATVTLPRARRTRSLPWAIAAVEGLIIVVLAAGMFVVRVGGASITTPQPRPGLVLPHAAAAETVGNASIAYGITGTGPGLARIADIVRHDLAAVGYGTPSIVTGTGPGLVEITGVSAPGPAPAVTGTGPGLIQIAGQS